MISNKQTKLITSLQKKKQRDLSSLYVIEGNKLVREYMEAGEEIALLAALPEWLEIQPKQLLKRIENISEVNPAELKKVSSLTSPNNALALVRIKKKRLNYKELEGKLSIALDFIQDPGNMGTIIRVAAWFGIKNIICSTNCVDAYSPKVIQSSMGAFLSTDIHYLKLQPFLIDMSEKSFPVFATTLKGNNIYKEDLLNKGIILFGNESKGISDELLPYVTQKLFIPGGSSLPGVESLNVATSASVVCSEFNRRKHL